MGESATLLRSFSHPSEASREAKEGDPIRALTESVSFGRFMSESLDWGKWSSFSHNRYQEEVERYSRPGSVAEMKAYFEAHYKRKAAERAAALAEEANATNDVVSEVNTRRDIQNDCLPMDTADSSNANVQVATNEQEQENIATNDNDFSNNMESGRRNNLEAMALDSAYSDNTIDVLEDSGNADMETVEMKYGVNEENLTQVNQSKQEQGLDVVDMIVAAKVQKSPDKEVADQEKSAPSSKKRHANSSSKSLAHCGSSRLPSLHPVKQSPPLPPPIDVNSLSTNSKKSVGDMNEKRRKIPKTLHMSINFSSCGSEISKASPKPLRDSKSFIPTPTKVKGLVSKHLSKFSQLEDKRSTVSRNCPKQMDSHHSLVPNMSRKSKLPLNFDPSDCHGNRAFVNKSISGGKAHSPIALSKSSKDNGTKIPTPIKSSPFRLRSEERVAKRKEFYQKLEEKNSSKEVEKTQVKEKGKRDTKTLRESSVLRTKPSECEHRSPFSPSNHLKKQEKPHLETENLRQSSYGCKAKPDEEVHCGVTPSLSHNMKKNLGTQPCLPKPGVKPTSSAVHNTSLRPLPRPSTNTESSKQNTADRYNRSTSMSVTSLPKPGRNMIAKSVQDTSNRPPWRSSMSTASLKRVIEKSNQKNVARSVTSLPKKNARENASPNIQS